MGKSNAVMKSLCMEQYLIAVIIMWIAGISASEYCNNVLHENSIKQ